MKSISNPIYYDPFDGSELISEQGGYRNKMSGHLYPIVNNIPRFVTKEGYTENFGFQWNRFSKTQLDSFSKTSITCTRLERCLNGHLDKIAGKLVLEAGSGAGRFTEILIKKEAVVHSFDLSNAVEANYSNNGSSDSLSLAQADIRRLPYKKEIYDCVICLGVVQHTPNPKESICKLYEMLKPGGILVFDHYLFKLRNVLPPPIGVASIVYRRLVLLLPQRHRFAAVSAIVTFFFPIHWFLRNTHYLPKILRRISPVIFYFGALNLKSKEQYFDWALLDTYDCLTDFYKHHRSLNQIKKYLVDLGAENIIVRKDGNGVEAFCQKAV